MKSKLEISPEVSHNFIAFLDLCRLVGWHGDVAGSFDLGLALRDVVVHHLALDSISDVVSPVANWTIVI